MRRAGKGLALFLCLPLLGCGHLPAQDKGQTKPATAPAPQAEPRTLSVLADAGTALFLLSGAFTIFFAGRTSPEYWDQGPVQVLTVTTAALGLSALGLKIVDAELRARRYKQETPTLPLTNPAFPVQH